MHGHSWLFCFRCRRQLREWGLMDQRTFCAYNETSKCFLSTRVVALDSAVEPLKTLKVLMEGPGADAGSGLWLIRFRGVPVARAFSPFDLIYLDKDLRVVHGVELTAESRFEPFKGQPASALILPSKTIVASKTRAGNQINMREVVDAVSDSAPLSQPSSPHSGPAQAAPHPQEFPTTAGRAPSHNDAPASMQSAAPAAQNAAMPDRAAHPEPSIPSAGHLPSGQQSRLVVERPPIANIPTRVVPAASAKSLHSPPEVGPSIRSADAASSGRLLKTMHTHPESPAVAEPAQPSDAKAIVQRRHPASEAPVQTPHGTIIPFPAPRVPISPAEPAKQEPTKQNVPLTAPLPLSAQKTPSPPSPEVAPETPAQPYGKELRAQTPEKDAAFVLASQTRKKIPWDVWLLYLFFPEFDPNHAAELRLPCADSLNEAKAKALAPSAKLKFLSWLYPELHLENIEDTRHEDRTAPRVSNPGLVGYFFTGGHSRPHEVKNISVSGFYMYTDERWLPGTIIRVTLQIVGSRGDRRADTVTVHSRVVRWGLDGGGFEFVLPGFVDE